MTNGEAGRVSFTTVVMTCLVTVMLIGVVPIMDFLYGMGLYPKVTQEEVVAAMKRQRPDASITCEPGTGGWDFVCHGVHKTRTGKTYRVKHGIVSSWISPTARSTTLPLDQPTPSLAEHEENSRNAIRREQDRRATLDLNRARMDQLRALPGVDEALAQRIAIAVIHKRFTSVDDVLTVEGMDRQKLERIRPLVRVDP